MPNNRLSLSATIIDRLSVPFYTEGPALDTSGTLYFTTVRGGKICRSTHPGHSEDWAGCGYPNGQRILANGDHLVCDSQTGEVIRFDPQGQRLATEVGGTIGGRPIQVPNDLAVDQAHGFYFTDSVRHDGAVFYVDFNGRTTLVADRLDFPNGIVLTPDKAALRVAESYRNRILTIQLQEVGIPAGKPEVFAMLPANPKPFDPDHPEETGNLPDGLALDGSGNLWVAHYGMQALQVISPSGEVIASIDTGIPATSNLCFAPNYKKVHVTGGKKEPGPGLVHTLILE